MRAYHYIYPTSRSFPMKLSIKEKLGYSVDEFAGN